MGYREFASFVEQQQIFISIRDVCDIIKDNQHVKHSKEMGFKISTLLFYVHDAWVKNRLYLIKVIDYLKANNCADVVCYGMGFGEGEYFGRNPFSVHPINDLPFKEIVSSSLRIGVIDVRRAMESTG